MTDYINEMKEKNHIITSIDAQKIEKKSTFFHDKKSQQFGHRRNAPQHNKSNIDKPTATQ